MKKDLTTGNITKTLLVFSGPMIAGNLLQQFYNIADTLIVGRFIGANAMAAVGTAYTLMTFLTSILIGLCMGSGSIFSFYFGKKEYKKMESCMRASFVMIGSLTVVVTGISYGSMKTIFYLLQVPKKIRPMMTQYVTIIFLGMFFVFLYNYFTYFLRSLGNSIVPLYFLGGASVLNIFLDLLFVVGMHQGIQGAATATVISQGVAGIGISIYTIERNPWFFRKKTKETIPAIQSVKEVARFSFAASVQQSVMNFGILVVQGMVNSFGVPVMAAFTAAVKIDSLAYMPAQEFGNAFSLYISQNYGAGETKRIQEGMKKAVKISMSFCIVVSAVVFLMAEELMKIFVAESETKILSIGAEYLRIEGACYCGIGVLFLLYAYYRGINQPEMSLVLTIISLGTRILLGYLLAFWTSIGFTGIWYAIVIGWFLADITGIVKIDKIKRKKQKKINKLN